MKIKIENKPIGLPSSLTAHYYIKANCNGGSGNYILEGNNLTLDPPVMTLIVCGSGSMDSEYLSLLNNVIKSTAFENEHLTIYSENASDRMFFTNGVRAEQKV